MAEVGPTFLKWEGKQTWRPGVYAQVDTSALLAQTTSVNNLCVIGSFPFLQGPDPAAGSQVPLPSKVTAASSLKNLQFSDKDLATLAKIIYSPDNDPNVNGQPSSVTLVNVDPNAQATLNITDGSTTSANQLTLKSSAWGTVGNKLKFTCTAIAASNLRNFTISRDGKTETFSSVGTLNTLPGTGGSVETSAAEGVLRFNYAAVAGTSITGTSVGYTRTGGFTLTQTTAADLMALAGGTAGTCVLDFHAGNGHADLAATVTLTIDGVAKEIAKGANVGQFITNVTNALDATTSVSVSDSNDALDTIELTARRVGSAAITVTSSDSQITVPAWTPGTDAASAAIVPVGELTNGTVSVTLSQEVPAAVGGRTEAYNVVVTGTNTGASASETLSFDAAGEQTLSTTAKFTTIDSVQITSSWADVTVTASPTFTYNVAIADHTFVKGAADIINTAANTAAGVTVQYASEAESIPYGKLDEVASTAISGGAWSAESPDGVLFPAHLYHTQKTLDGATLVSAEEVTGAKGDYLNTADAFLSGGSQSTGGAADWTSALSQLRLPQWAPEIIVALNTGSSFHKQVIDHCEYMAGLGRHECNAWFGAPSSSAIATLKGHVTQLNSRHGSLVFQDIYTTDAEGNSKWYTPEWTALMMASMQASTDIATPLTRKVPNVLDVRQAAGIALQSDVDGDGGLIQSGLVTLMPTANSWWVERSVTTHQADTNMVFTEMSANESVNTSIRDLRTFLAATIGDPNVAASKARIESIVRTRLDRQVKDGVIKAFDAASIEIVDLGDSYNVRYTAAPTFPINFILLEATFVAVL